MGGAIGYLFYNTKTPVYRSSALFQTTLLQPYEVESIIQELNKTIKNKNLSDDYKNLRASQNIIIANPKNISTPRSQSEYEVMNRLLITVEIESTVQDKFPNMGVELANFFNDNTELQRLAENKKEVTEKLVSRIEGKLKRIEESGMENVSIQEMSVAQESIYSELSRAELALKELTIFEEIKPFYTPKHRSGNMLYYVFVGAVLTFIFSLLVFGIYKS